MRIGAPCHCGFVCTTLQTELVAIAAFLYPPSHPHEYGCKGGVVALEYSPLLFLHQCGHSGLGCDVTSVIVGLEGADTPPSAPFTLLDLVSYQGEGRPGPWFCQIPTQARQPVEMCPVVL